MAAGLARIELATFRLGNGRSSVELQPREFEGLLGLEPRIYSLKDCCSTIELEAHTVFSVPLAGLEPTTNRLEGERSSVELQGQICNAGAAAGVEPAAALVFECDAGHRCVDRLSGYKPPTT